MSEPAPEPAPSWTVWRRDRDHWHPLLEDGRPVDQAVLALEPHRFTYRYRAVQAAVLALFDGADAVAVDRRPPLP